MQGQLLLSTLQTSLLTLQYGQEEPSFWVLSLLREVTLGGDFLVGCGFLLLLVGLASLFLSQCPVSLSPAHSPSTFL